MNKCKFKQAHDFVNMLEKYNKIKEISIKDYLKPECNSANELVNLCLKQIYQLDNLINLAKQNTKTRNQYNSIIKSEKYLEIFKLFNEKFDNQKNNISTIIDNSKYLQDNKILLETKILIEKVKTGFNFLTKNHIILFDKLSKSIYQDFNDEIEAHTNLHKLYGTEMLVYLRIHLQ